MQQVAIFITLVAVLGYGLVAVLFNQDLTSVSGCGANLVYNAFYVFGIELEDPANIQSTIDCGILNYPAGTLFRK